DGSYVAYEAGPLQAPQTHVVRATADAVQPVAVVTGGSAAFDSAGRQLAYLRPKAGDVGAAAATPAAQTLAAARGDLVVRDLAAGTERIVPTGTLLKSAPLFSADGKSVLFVGADAVDATRSDVYAVDAAGSLSKLTDQPGHKTNLMIDPRGSALVYTVAVASPFAAGGGRAGGVGAGAGRGG